MLPESAYKLLKSAREKIGNSRKFERILIEVKLPIQYTISKRGMLNG